ncbi:MAG: RluA family pseudouridine synthase [Burkholderiales bacterium]|nr:RluA family pseudouridine synthase [Burkholderiales bacterium]
MNELGNARARVVAIDEASAGQRVDNFLLRELKGVPRSHVYRLVRSGEVRVNSRRVDVTYRLQSGDRVRVPPVRTAAAAPRPAPARPVEFPVVLEDDALLVIDKPAGVAVHGGSGVSAGVIEQLRAARPAARFLELVHRLDRDTSGLLIVAKKRPALLAMHRALREGAVDKRYLVLVKGRWTRAARDVALPLRRYLTAAGERRVSVNAAGQASRTRFELERRLDGFSLLAATIETGRTHQIRVQLAHLGFPVAGDDKYGDFELNRTLARRGLRRMFLHAERLSFAHPRTGERVTLAAPLPDDLRGFLDALQGAPADAAAV